MGETTNLNWLAGFLPSSSISVLSWDSRRVQPRSWPPVATFLTQNAKTNRSVMGWNTRRGIMTSPSPNQKRNGQKRCLFGIPKGQLLFFQISRIHVPILKKNTCCFGISIFLVTLTQRWNAGAIILSLLRQAKVSRSRGTQVSSPIRVLNEWLGKACSISIMETQRECYFWIMNLHECVKRWVKICEMSNLIKDQRSNSSLFLLGIDQPRYISLMKINECVFDQLPFLRTRFRDSTSSSELASRKPCCAGSGALPGRVKSTVFQPAWAVRRWDPKF